MAHLSRDRTITVTWKMFTDLMGLALYNSPDTWKNSIYVIGDSTGRPLYIGKATGERNPGFGNRYWGDLMAMAAWGHGARNSVYLGTIKGARRQWYFDLERELIVRESDSTDGRAPKYNSAHKDGSPDERIRLHHAGQAPTFYHLVPP